MKWIKMMFAFTVSFVCVTVVAVLPTVAISEEYAWYSALCPDDVLGELSFYLVVTAGFLMLTVFLCYMFTHVRDEVGTFAVGVGLLAHPMGMTLFFKRHILVAGLLAGIVIMTTFGIAGKKVAKPKLSFFLSFFPYYVYITVITVFAYVIYMLN